MIDGIKIPLKGADAKRLQSASGLRLVGNFDKETGYVFETARGKFPGFYVKVRNEYELTIHGSLPVFYNSIQGIGPTNADQFTYEKCCKAIALFCDLLRFEPNDLPLSTVEFGLNLVSPILPTSEFISRALMLGSMPFHTWEGGIGKEIDIWDYCFKFYDKVKQQKIRAQTLKPDQKARLLQSLGHAEILRVELKAKRMRFVEDQGLVTVGDLLRIEVWESCFRRLEEYLQDLVFSHTINEIQAHEQLTKRQCAWLAESKHIDYFVKLESSRKRRDTVKRLHEFQARFNDPSILRRIIDHARKTFAALTALPLL